LNSYQNEFLTYTKTFPKTSSKNLYDDRASYNKMKNVNKNEQILKEIKECTFKPKLNVNRSDINSSKLVSLK